MSFRLTSDQIRAIDKISERQKSKCYMASLLQGDVGNGKTVIALFMMLNVIENNMQAALMGTNYYLGRAVL
nr:hypothetical protein [Wolbachia endosymbiont of Litomosoides sigmodontis]